MLTTTPLPRSSISGSVARMVRNGPVRFTASTRFQSSSLVSSTVAATPMPATFTSTWGGPMVTATFRVTEPTLSGSHTSTGKACARPPACWIRARVSASPAASRSIIAIS
jgi:hypothetical protein